MDRTVSVEVVGRTLRSLLGQSERQLAMLDRATGKEIAVSRELASSPAGFLPVFLVASDSVWREATGKSFGIQLARDSSALLGYRSESIGTGPFSAVMLSMMDAIEQTARPGMLLMNDFDRLWRTIESGLGEAAKAEYHATPSPGARA